LNLSDPVKWQFPAKLGFLFEPCRTKVAHGGRGGSKSWGFARALLLEGADHVERVLCTREVQNSIKDSVHQLLKDQIDSLGLGGFYTATRDEIVGKNGTRFLFSGLSNQTTDSLKSYEGVTKCWVEEAHGVTRRSWDVLIPTIRAENSEIWISLNPELDTDETWVRFCESPQPDSKVVQINWQDNPWFPAVLEKERQEFLRQVALGKRTQDDYDNIWEGKCRAAVVGAIYSAEVSALKLEGRYCRIPHDPMLPVHTVWDLGWNDSMVVGMWQKSPMGLMLIDSIITSHTKYSEIVADLDKRKYRWGKDFLPHDGKHKNPQTGESAAVLLGKLGRPVHEPGVPDIGVEQGIKAVRQAFPRIWIDNQTGDNREVLNALRRYKRRVNQQTNEPGEPTHDDASHPSDMVRYAVASASEMVDLPVIKNPYAGFERKYG
jgi:phage terminase large subunit